MVGAVGLALASANLDIVGEAGLIIQMLVDLSRSKEDAFASLGLHFMQSMGRIVSLFKRGVSS